MFQPPNKLWALILVCVVLALPLPPAQRSHADDDEKALQPPVPAEKAGQVGGGKAINEAELEARVLARLRHQVHGEVDDLAMRSMEQAMRRLRDRDSGEEERPLGKVLRLSFRLEPELAGTAPVSVLSRTRSYSAFADTVSKGTQFRLNVAGELRLRGLRQDRVLVDFSTLLQFEDVDSEESGSAGATGSAELLIGEPEILMSVGARDLVLTVDEVGLP